MDARLEKTLRAAILALAVIAALPSAAPPGPAQAAGANAVVTKYSLNVAGVPIAFRRRRSITLSVADASPPTTASQW